MNLHSIEEEHKEYCQDNYNPNKSIRKNKLQYKN
jgi:hypothetical protein